MSEPEQPYVIPPASTHEAPVVIRGAFTFGFKAGFGFLLAQLIAGGVIYGFWYLLTLPMT